MIAANAGGAWTPIGKGRMENGRMEGSKGGMVEWMKVG